MNFIFATQNITFSPPFPSFSGKEIPCSSPISLENFYAFYEICDFVMVSVVRKTSKVCSCLHCWVNWEILINCNILNWVLVGLAKDEVLGRRSKGLWLWWMLVWGWTSIITLTNEFILASNEFIIGYYTF